MGVLLQFGLLLQRYLTIRKRQPVILLLEVLWPLLIFLIVAVVRQGAQPISKPNCHYRERAMPNAGIVPFVQSFVCNLNNECHSKDGKGKAEAQMQKLSSLVGGLAPHLSNPDTLKALRSLKDAKVLLDAFNKNLKNDSGGLLDYVRNGIRVRELLKDPDELRRMIVEEQGAINGAVLDAILHASLNINKVMDIMDDFDITGIVCNATLLNEYVIFGKAVNVTEISDSLCSINPTLLPDIVELFQAQLNVVKIMRILATIQESFGDYDIAQGFKDVGSLLDLILNTKSLKPYLENFKELFGLSDILRKVPGWITKMMSFSKNTMVFSEIVRVLDPFIAGLSNNSPVWEDIKDGVYYADEVLDTFTKLSNDAATSSNGTNGIGVPLKAFFKDVSQAETLLRTKLPDDAVSEIMKLELKLDKLTPYLRSTSGGQFLPMFCNSPGSPKFIKSASSVDAESRLEIFLCKPSGSNKTQEFLALLDPKLVQAEVIQARLKMSNPVSFDLAAMMEKGLKYIEKLIDIPPEIMNILKSLSGIRLESTLEVLFKLFNGSANAADTLTMMSGYLNNLDQTLSSLPTANVTRILMAITEISLDTIREAVDTLTAFEEYLETLLRDDLRVVTAINRLLELGPRATKAVLAAFTDPKKLMVLINETTDIQGLFCSKPRLSEFLNMPIPSDLDSIQDILCGGNISVIVQEALQRLHLTELKAMFTSALNDIEGYMTGLKDPTSRRFNLTSIAVKSQALMTSVTKAFQTTSRTWKELFQGVADIRVNGTEWRDVWPKFTSNIWTGSVVLLMETWGPTMERSDLWHMMGPYIRVADVIMQRVVYQMNYMSHLYGPNTTLGRVLDYYVEYAPEMLEAIMSLTEDPRAVSDLFASHGFGVICDPQKMRSVGRIPDNLPYEEISALMCGIDYNQLMYEVMSVFDMTTTIQEISMLLNKTLGRGDAPGFDWSKLVEHAKQMIESFQNSNDFTVLQDLFMKFNSTKFSIVFDQFWTRLQHMSLEDYGSISAIALSVGNELDRSLANFTVWRIAKYYINTYDTFFERFNMNMAKGKGFSFSIQDLYPNATKLAEYMKKFGEAVPEFLEAVGNFIMHPYKITQVLMQTDLANKTLCNGIQISSFLDLKNTDNIDRLEESLCQFNWLGVIQELTQDPAISKLTVALQNYYSGLPVEDIALNWTKLMVDVSGYFENLYKVGNETPMFEIPGLNMTAVDISYKDLVNVATTYYTDPSRAQALTMELYPLLDELVKRDETYGMFWKMQKIYMYILNQFFMVANQNLPRLQQGKVNLVDFLHSEELDKIVASMKASPEIVQLLLDTIVDIMTDPVKGAKISDPSQWMQVCSHQATFESFFPEAARLQINLRGTICNATMVNITKLVSELQGNIGGLRQMIQAVTAVLKPGYPSQNLSLNYTAFYRNSDRFTQIITSMVQTPPQIDLGLGTRWMNESLWQGILDTFGERFQSAFQNMQTMGFGDLYKMMIPTIEQQLLPYKDKPEFKETILIVDDTVRRAIVALEQLIDKNATSLQALLVDYPTLEKIFELSSSLPQILATVAYSNAINPQQLNMLTGAATSWDSFCALDISRYMESVPGLNFNIGEFMMEVCQLNITKLREEVEAFTGTTVLMSFDPIGVNQTANVTATLLDLGRLFDLYIGLIGNPPLGLVEVFDWLNGTVWKMSFETVGKSYADPATMLRLLQSLDTLTPLLDNLTKTDSFVGVMWKMQKSYLYILNQFLIMANRNLPRFLHGEVNLLDFFHSEELGKIAAALEASPDIVKVLFDSMLDIMADQSKSAKFSDPRLLQQICSDAASFQTLFPESLTSQVDIQGVICNATMINATKLISELEGGVYGLSQMIQAMVKAMQPGATVEDLKVNFNSTMKNYDLFMGLLTNLTVSPPRIELGFGQGWVNASQWEHLWMEFNRELVNITQTMQAMGLMDYAKAVVPYWEMQFQPLYQLEGFNATLFYIDTYAANTLQMLKLLDASSPAEMYGKLREFPSLQKLFHLTDEIPKLLATLLYPKATFTAKDNMEAFTSVGSWDDFCRLNMSFIFPGFGDTTFSPETFKEQLCQINITDLPRELMLFGGGPQSTWETTFQTYTWTNNGSTSSMNITNMRMVFNVTVSQTILTVMDLIQTYEKTMQSQTDVTQLFAMFNGTVWNNWFGMLDRQYADLGALGRIRDLALSLRPAVQLLIESQPIRDQLSPSMLRGLDGMVDYLTNFINMLKVGKIPNLWESYQKLPFFQNVFKLMDNAPDIVDVLMETLMDPQKSMVLLGMIAKPSSSLGTFCNYSEIALDFIFVKPVNSSVNLTNVQDLICSLDFAGLDGQMNNLSMKEYGFIFDIFQPPSNGTDTFDIADLLRNIDNLQDRLVNISFRPPDPNSFEQNNVNSYLPFLKLFSGTSWAPVFEKISAKLTSDPASFLDILMSLQPLLGQLMQSPQAATILQGADQTLVFLTSYFQMIQEGKILNPLDMFRGAPNFQNILGLLDDLPELVEILIETMVSPVKSQAFASLLAVQPGLAFQTFCNATDLTRYLEKPVNSSVDLNAVRNTICKTKYEEIPLEINNATFDNYGFLYQMILPQYFPASGTIDVNQTIAQFFEHLQTFQQAFNNLTLHPPDVVMFQMTDFFPFLRWFDSARWSAMFSRVGQRMVNQDPSRFAALGDQLGPILAGLPLDKTQLTIFQIVTTYMNVILEKMDDIDGKTTIRLADLFPDSPSIQALANLLDENPEVVEVLMYSLNDPKFTRLYSMNVDQALQSICAGAPGDFFSVPHGSEQALARIITEFCSINLTSLAGEFLHELRIPQLQSELMSNTTTFNLTMYLTESQRLQGYIQKWIQTPPPQLVFSDKWTNESYWMDMLTDYGQNYANNPNQAVDQTVQIYMSALMPLLPLNDPAFQQIAVAMGEVAKIVRDKLYEFAGQNLTIEMLFEDAPRVKRLVLDALDIAPDLLDTLFTVSIKSQAKLVELFTSGNWKAMLCTSDNSLKTMFKLPVSINATEVQALICGINETLLSVDFMHLFGINKILEKLQNVSQGNVTIDWRGMFQASQDLSRAIDNLIRNPPHFQKPHIDVAGVEAVAQTFLRELGDQNNLMNLFQIYSALDVYLRGTPGWETVNSYYVASDIILKYMNDLLSKITQNGRTIDLAKIFGNSPRVRNLLDLAFHLGPDFITGFLSATVKPEMSMDLAAGRLDLDRLFCSEAEMRQYFTFHSSFNLTYAVSALCHFNTSQILQELMKEFSLQTIADELLHLGNSSERFDVQDYIRQTTKFTENVMKLFNSTGFTFGKVDVVKYFQFNGSVDQLLLNTYSMAVSPNASSYATQLQLLMPLLEGSDFWRYVRPELEAVNILADFFNRKLTLIETAPITLANLVRNATYFRNFLGEVFKFGPEFLNTFMNLKVNQAMIPDLPVLPDFTNWTAADWANYTFPPLPTVGIFAPNYCYFDLFLIPPDANATAIREIACNLNASILVEELKREVDYDKLMAELMKIGKNSSEPFDWGVFLTNIQMLVEKIGYLPHANISIPSFPEFLAAFFDFDGNMHDWLERLQRASGYNNGILKGESLAIIEMMLRNFANSMAVPTPESLNKVVDAVGRLLTLVEDQLLATDTDGEIDLTEVFNRHPPYIDPLQLLNGLSPLVPQLVTLKFKTPKLMELARSPNRKEILCGNTTTWQELFNLPDSVDPQLTALMELVFCNATAGYQSTVFDVIAGYSDTSLVLENLLRVIGSSKDRPYNSSQVTTTMNRLLDLIFVRPAGQAEQLSPALRKLLDMWTLQVPTVNAKLFEVGMKTVLSLFGQSSTFNGDWSRVAKTVDVWMGMNTAMLHRIVGNPVGLKSLFIDNSPLWDLLQASMKMNRGFMDAIFAGYLRLDKLLPLVTRQNGGEELCQTDTFNEVFSLPVNYTMNNADIHTILCQNSSQLLHLLGGILNVDVSRFMGQLKRIWDWSVPPPTVDWEALYLKTSTFVDLMGKLVGNPPSTEDMILGYLTGTNNTAPTILNKLAKGDPQVWIKMVTMVTEILGDFYDTNHFLYPFFQFLDSSVIQRFTNQVKMFQDLLSPNSTDGLGAYLNIGNLAREEISALSFVDIVREEVCEVHWFHAWYGNQPMISAPAVSEALCNKSGDMWYDNLIQANLGPADILFLAAQLQSKYVFEAYYGLRKSPALSSLDWQGFTTRLQGMITQLGIPIPGLGENGGNNILNQLGSGSLEALTSTLDILRALDPMLNSPEWNSGKPYVQLFSEIFSLTNTLLERLSVTNSTLKLINLYPNASEVISMLQSASKPEHSAELLTASIRPAMLLSVVQAGNLESVACDPAKFDQTFVFEAPINSTAVRISLCEAAKANATFMDKILNQLDVKSIIQEIARVNKDWESGNVLDGRSLWDFAIRQVERFKENLKQLQQITSVDSGMQEWATAGDMMSLVMTNHSGIYRQTCDAILPLFNKNYYEYTLKPMLSNVMGGIRLARDQLKVTDNFEIIACDLPGKTLPEVLQKLGNIHFFNLIEQYINMYSWGSKPITFDCGELLQFMVDMSTSTTNLGTRLADPAHNQTGQCLYDMLYEDAKAITDLDSIFSVMNQVLLALGDPNVQKLSNVLIGMSDGFKPVLPSIQLFIRALLGQQQVALKLADITTNYTDVVDYIVDLWQLSPEIVNALFQSTLNLNIGNLFNGSAVSVSQIFCDATQLGKYISLPDGFNLSLAMVSKNLCGPNLTEAINYVQTAIDLGQIALQLTQIRSGNLDAAWFQGLAVHVSDLMSKVQGLTQLLDVNFDNVDYNEVLPKLQRFLKENGPEAVVESLELIIDDFQAVSANNSVTTVVIDVLKTAARGLLGLDIIKRMIIPDIGDLLENKEAVWHYMVDELGFRPDVADAILKSEISVSVGQHARDIDKFVCNPAALGELILLDKKQTDVSKVTIDDISNALCKMDADTLPTFTQTVFRGMNIRDLLGKFLTYTADGLLAGSGMDIKEAKAIFQELADAQDDLVQASKKFDDISKEFNLDKLLPTPEALSSSSKAISALLCNESMSVDDQFGLSKAADEKDGKEGSEDEFTDNQKKEINTYANLPFCQDVLKTMFRSGGGSIIWAYMKPLLVGKILYSPNTPYVREIISKSNGTFQLLTEVHDIAEDWAAGADDLRDFVASSDQFADVRELLSSEVVSRIVERTFGVSGTSISTSLNQLDSLSVTQIDQLKSVAGSLANYSNCLKADRWQGFDTAEDLFKEAEKLQKKRALLAAVEFIQPEGSPTSRKKRQASPGNVTIPKNIVYKIRMDLDNVPITTFLKDRVWRPIPEDDFADDLRYLRGFVQLQEMLDRAIIELHTGEDGPQPSVYLQQFPFPCHKEDLFLHVLSFYLLPVMMTLAWVGSLGMAIKILMYDRENGLEETLKVMGLTAGVNWFAWLTVTMTFMVLISVLEVVILKLSSVFTYSSWLILILFLVDFAFSSILMCYMVSAFFTRANMAALTALIVYLISYLPFVLMTTLEHEMSFTQKLLASLSSTTAFGFACQYMSRYEEQLVGVQWSNIDKSAIVGDEMTFSWACIMMVVDSAIYLIIGWYVRNIIPRKYGMRQPWYFPVSPAYWGCSNGNGQSQDKYVKAKSRYGMENDAINLDMLIEPAGDQSHEVGIGLVNLSKTYKGDHPAVDQLSVDFYKGQITSLLGHNGAGKTTAINMLTGVIRPTHGTALINGRNIHKSLTKIRQDVGICPQHNTLFDYMTVKEHLEFYMGLKNNYTGKSKKQEIERLLHSVDLVDERDVPASQLSGGMKRRLCVALAFAGGANTIILDEPTSGVDPNARRRIWDVILHNRHNRTILLSTHHLDEADILSNRIAILNEGKLLCCGSSLYLKKQLGSGYHLTVSKDAEASSSSEAESARDSLGSDVAANILGFVRKTVPRAEIEEEVGTEVKYTLPVDEGERDRFHDLFTDLDDNMHQLGIVSYGVSESTLEEVFLKACYLADAGKPLTTENLKGWNQKNFLNGSSDKISSKGSENELSNLVKGPEKQRSSGLGRMAQQFSALWLKRFHHYRRDWRLLLTLVLLPIIFIAMGMGFTIVQRELVVNPPVVLTPSMYGDGLFSFLKLEKNDSLFNRMSNVMRSKPGLGTTCMAEMRKWPYIRDEFNCNPNPGNAFLAQNNDHIKKNVTCYCEDNKYMCEGETFRPPQVNTTTTDILQNYDGIADVDQYLLDSFYTGAEKRYGGWTYEEVVGNSQLEYKVKVWFNNKGHHAIPAYINTLSNTILRSRLDSSQSPEEYGITAINHPYQLSPDQISEDTLLQKAGDTGIALVILMAFSFIPATFIIYNVNERLKREKRLQYISGVSAFNYWFVAFIWDMMIFAITVGFFVVLAAIFQVGIYWDKMNLYSVVVLLLLYGSSVTCMMYMTVKWFRNATTAYMLLFCLNMLLGIMMTFTLFLLSFFQWHPVISQVHTYLQYIFMIFPQFCLGEGLIRVTTNQMLSELFGRFGEDVYQDPFSFDMLGWLYIAMGIETVVFFIMTLLTEIDTRPLFRNKKPKEDVLEDEDVTNERHRVEHEGMKTDVVLARNLSKLYIRGLKKVVAVDNITFGVKKGECFGLLGVNGAGKTTTFKMLTGDIQPSGGNALLKGNSIRKLTAQLRQCMGYCPQDDALDDYLTGREMLQCHGRLKGMSNKDIEEMINAISTSLDMESLLDKTTRAYSGGMKRKLSVAIAIMGSPDIVYLDEPTAGMDPGNRRLVWNVISDLVRAGQSLILTSHSMAECDALCTRLAIMVNGRFTCMGSPQHLKHKFSEGYTVILRVRNPTTNGHSVSEFMYATFPGAQFKDQHHGTLEFTIPVESAKLALIFGHIERHKDQLGIQDYSVQQTTLDSVFISFAKRQTDGLVDSPDGSVTETDVETSKGTLTKSDMSLSGPFVNETYAYMNPRLNLKDGIELQPRSDSGYFAQNLRGDVSRHSSQRSEKAKVNPLAYDLGQTEEFEYVTHL